MGKKKKKTAQSSFSKEGMGIEQSRNKVRNVIVSRDVPTRKPNIGIREELNQILSAAKKRKEIEKQRVSNAAHKGISDLKINWNHLTSMMSGLKVKERPKEDKGQKQDLKANKTKAYRSTLSPKSYYQKWIDLVIKESKEFPID